MMPTANNSESSQMLALAFDSHREGKLEEAALLYRKCLPYFSPRKDNMALKAAIHNNLGAALRGLRDYTAASEEFVRAIELMPEYPEAFLNLGVVRMEQQQFEEAAASFHKAIAIRPDCAEAYNNLAAALRRQGRLDDAAEAALTAIRLKADYLHAQLNLASIYQESNKLEESAQVLAAILAKYPDCAEAYLYLGVQCYRAGQSDLATQMFDKVRELRPDCADTYINMAAVLKDQRHLDAALEAAQTGVKLKPSSPEAHLNLGAVLHDQGKLQEAAEHYRQAISLRSTFAEAYTELGSVLSLQGDLSGLDSLRKALEINPALAAGHWNLAAGLLRAGEYAEGWQEYEWRWRWNGFTSRSRGFQQPRWHGEDLHGARILLHAEQGQGDTLQFVRYAPLVAKRGGKVILEVQPSLKELLQHVAGVHQVIGVGEPLPDFEWQCPLMSLPLTFGTTVQNIPATVPYIKFPGARTKHHFGQHKMRVGLVWTGNPAHRGDLLRSIPVKMLSAFAKIENVEFVALQQGLSEEQREEAFSVLPMEWKLFQNFQDTANSVKDLDLVLSIDTSVAHLAGAMGKPVWILLAHATDWRWFTEREDSPWYPTARLFRQTIPHDWEGVISRAATELKAVIQAGV